jgi:hypothetical protein
MGTATQIQEALRKLPPNEKLKVLEFLNQETRAEPEAGRGHSVLEIPAVSLGKILPVSSGDEDLLGEMVEDRV